MLQLFTTEGFIDAFWQMANQYDTQEAAYEALETEYRTIFGRRKYSYFNSFRVVRDRKVKCKQL